jgi:hypothetical protein
MVARYGLRTIELARRPAAVKSGEQVFGRYRTPGHVLLFEQPEAPWHLPGWLPDEATRRLERCGAVVTRYPDSAVTRVDWPHDALRRFMLEDVLRHELGHHVLQHNRGKRTVRVARTRDHEAFATRFARRQPLTDKRRRNRAG